MNVLIAFSFATLAQMPMEQSHGVSCSAASLYALYDFVGEPTDWEELDRVIGKHPTVTLATVEAISNELDRPVRFSACKKGDGLPNRPFLAAMKPKDEGGVGHLVCVRPFSVRDRLFQVVNPPWMTEILYESEIVGDPRFAEIVAVRQYGWPAVTWMMLIGACGLLLSVALKVLASRRNPRSPIPL